MNKLISELGASPAQDFADRAVAGLRRAYSFNADRYKPDRGDDERLFGVAVWRTGVFELGQHYVDLPNSEILGEDVCFEIEVAGRKIRFYKMPPRLGDNIEAFGLSGSKVKESQASSNDKQLDLFAEAGIALVTGGRAELSFSRLIVLHQGTPTDGLRWVVVGAPSTARGWHWWEKIYDAGWGESNGDVTGTSGPLEPTGPQLPPLDVRLKPALWGQPDAGTS